MCAWSSDCCSDVYRYVSRPCAFISVADLCSEGVLLTNSPTIPRVSIDREITFVRLRVVVCVPRGQCVIALRYALRAYLNSIKGSGIRYTTCPTAHVDDTLTSTPEIPRFAVVSRRQPRRRCGNLAPFCACPQMPEYCDRHVSHTTGDNDRS